MEGRGISPGGTADGFRLETARLSLPQGGLGLGGEEALAFPSSCPDSYTRREGEELQHKEFPQGSWSSHRTALISTILIPNMTTLISSFPADNLRSRKAWQLEKDCPWREPPVSECGLPSQITTHSQS